jgi:hypothetical protein
MNRSHPREFCARLAPFAWLGLLGLGACTGTETDNPAADMKPPPYESPIDFVPGRGSPPGCVPPRDHGKPRQLPLWGRDGSRLVGADRYAGIRVVDASDPSAPQLAGQLALAGTPYAVLVEPGPFVTVALDEQPAIQGAEVPAPSMLEAVTRLVRYDVRDALSIARVADVDIEGELWSLSQRGELTWVMSARLVGVEPSCDREPFRCDHPTYDALLLTAYRVRDGAYEQVQRVELPMNRHAWTTTEGFAAFESSTGGDADGGVLRAVRFAADGLLGPVSELQLPRPTAEGLPLSLAGDQVRVLLRDLSDGSAELAIFDLTSGVRLGSLPRLLQSGPVRFSARAVYFGDESGRDALLVDTSDASAPRITALPSPLAQLWPLDAEGTRLLGLDRAPIAPVFTLLQVGLGGLEVLDQLAVTDAQGGLTNETTWLQGDHLLFAYPLPDMSRRLDALAIGDTSLTRLSVAEGGFPTEVVIGEDVVYAPDPFGLTVGSIGSPPAGGARLTWGEQIEAYVAAGQREAALVQRLGAQLELRITVGAETTALRVSPGASRLIADGDRLLVVSSDPVEQCMQSGADCSGYTPNVELYRFEGEPERIASIPLPDSELNVSDADSQVRLEWEEVAGSPFALGDGRYVFAARLYASCTREAACERLGIEPRPIGEANVAPSGRTACPPNVTCPPASEPATVYGKKDALRFYVVDVHSDEPRFSAVAESVLELGDSRFGSLRVSAGELLVPRLEREVQRPTPGAPSSQAPATARFMLDRFALASDGALHSVPAINVPGYALALRAGGQILISAAPDPQQAGAATLHRLALRDNGAHVLQSLALDAEYGQLELVGDRAIYLQRRGEGCAGTTRLVPVLLPDDADGELRAQPALELPGSDWTLIDARGSRLLLQARSLRYAVVELGDGAPRVHTFVAGSHYMEEPRLASDAIVGAGSFWGKQRIAL